MVSKYGEVLLRGILAIIIVPVFFYMISTLVNTTNVLNMLAGQRPIVAFIIVDLIPLSYFIIGIIWTLAPLFRKDTPPNIY